MGRFSQNQQEDLHIGQMARELFGITLVELHLKGGLVVTGIVRNVFAGNDGVVAGTRRYRGEVSLELIDKTIVAYDFLDIEKVENVWKVKVDQFRAAGLV